MDILSRSPVPFPFLILGKLAFALFAVGGALALLALVHLGRSAAVGIPDRMTELKTRGVYHISRNPVYLGGFLTCAGSCLFSIYPLNILLCAIAIAVHHWIVTKEEQFLEESFGEQWREYCAKVPRYIGRTWNTDDLQKNGFTRVEIGRVQSSKEQGVPQSPAGPAASFCLNP